MHHLRFAGAALLAALASASTLADSGSIRMPADAPAAWKNECSSCHVAYPPQLLGKSSWQGLMKGLDKHFGSDASMAAADAKAITDFLDRYAPPDGGRHDAATGRITQTPWFTRKHREIPASALTSKEVRSAANCQACHSSAEKGVFSEHQLTPLGRRFED